jgi:ABC-type antimicrobial peptide transport system, ATPase component
METEQIVKLEGVYKRFPAGKTEFTALNNINLSFGKGEFAGLVGRAVRENYFAEYNRVS